MKRVDFSIFAYSPKTGVSVRISENGSEQIVHKHGAETRNRKDTRNRLKNWNISAFWH